LSAQVWLHTYATAGVRNAFSNYVLSEFTAEKFSTDIAEKHRRIFIKCEKSQHMVGYLRLDFESPCPSDPNVKTEIATLYVQEHHARQGIGRGLLDQAALACRTRNIPDFWLSVNHENQNAIRFYDSLGFKRAGSMYFELDGEKHENFVLRRSTNQPASSRMIRKATTADRPRISEIRNAVRENKLSPGSVSTVANTARWIYDNGTFWVWEEEGAVQGFAVADTRDGTIFGLFVHPDHEGRGIARALLPLACSDLKRAGFTFATLNTGPGTRAERFYRADGWTDTGRRDADGEIIFEKAL